MSATMSIAFLPHGKGGGVVEEGGKRLFVDTPPLNVDSASEFLRGK